MEWHKLDLTRASAVKKEVDQVVLRLQEIANNPAFVDKGTFLSMVQNRILELEDFYLAHSDDERAGLFEKERLRLRKVIQPLLMNKDGRSISGQSGELNQSGGAQSQGPQSVFGGEKSVGSGPFFRNNTAINTTSNSGNNVTSGHTSTKCGVMTDVRSARGSKLSNNCSVSNRSIISSVSKKAHPIYSWEEKSERVPRDEIVVDGISFVPSMIQGFYSRQFQHGETEEILSDRFMDFQIILTQEEVATLAARRKAEKHDNKLVKNIAAATSVHTATPYVEPKRIVQEMLRPGQPDRWIHPDGMKPVMK